MNHKKLLKISVLLLVFLIAGGLLFANGNKDSDDYYQGRGYGHMGSGGIGSGGGMMGRI